MLKPLALAAELTPGLTDMNTNGTSNRPSTNLSKNEAPLTLFIVDLIQNKYIIL
jgi:hypothetical protein